MPTRTKKKTKVKAKTKAKTKKSQLNAVRDRLIRQRDEILSMYEHDLKVGQKANDEGAEDLVDRATSAYNREFTLALSGTERGVLLQIEEALGRLESGGYGVCFHCEQKILAQRLRAVPWARYCVDCQELSEQGLLEDA